MNDAYGKINNLDLDIYKCCIQSILNVILTDNITNLAYLVLLVILIPYNGLV